jgi:hypothetical protein
MPEEGGNPWRMYWRYVWRHRVKPKFSSLYRAIPAVLVSILQFLWRRTAQTSFAEMRISLSATVARLPPEDAIDVWNAASQKEKKALRQAMLGKVSNFEKMVTERRKTIEEFRALKPRITQFLADKP